MWDGFSAPSTPSTVWLQRLVMHWFSTRDDEALQRTFGSGRRYLGCHIGKWGCYRHLMRRHRRHFWMSYNAQEGPTTKHYLATNANRAEVKKPCWDILPADEEWGRGMENYMWEFMSLAWQWYTSLWFCPKSTGNTQQWMRLGSVEGWWPGRRGAGLLSICPGSDMRHICLQLWPIKVLFRSLSIYALLLLKSFRLINRGCNTDLGKLL